MREMLRLQQRMTHYETCSVFGGTLWRQPENPVARCTNAWCPLAMCNA